MESHESSIKKIRPGKSRQMFIYAKLNRLQFRFFKVHLHREKRTRKRIFTLILVTAQCEQYIGRCMNPSGSDVAFAQI